jgi:hypothetical protein
LHSISRSAKLHSLQLSKLYFFAQQKEAKVENHATRRGGGDHCPNEAFIHIRAPTYTPHLHP